MSEQLVYEQTPRTSVNRLKNRGVYDQETIHSIIDSTPVLHVSFMPGSIEDDPFPAILPMIGCTGAYIDPSSPTACSDSAPAPSIYLHGHVSARLLKLPGSSFTEEHLGEWPKGGHPVAISATHVDGIVLAYTPFNHSMNYRSAVVHGWAYLVDDPNEKMWALELITDSVLPDRWENSRVPPTETEMKTTRVLRVEIVSASAKCRNAAPGNVTNDLIQEEMRRRVWTGVIPSWIRYGEPVAARENMVDVVPDHIRDWVDEQNKGSEEHAVRVASLPYPKK